jgi:FG-GAP-like repeat
MLLWCRGDGWRLLQRLAACVCVLPVLTSCGGSSQAPAESAPLKITATLVGGGTYVRCDAPSGQALVVTRETAVNTFTTSLACPSSQVLPGDWALSRWSVQRKDATATTAPLATTLTQLPTPVAVRDGSRWVVVGQSPLTEGRVPGLQLESDDGKGNILARNVDMKAWTAFADTAANPGATPSWRWSAKIGTQTFVSPTVQALGFSSMDYDAWGPLAVGDVHADKKPVLAGTSLDANGALSTRRPFGDLGLEHLYLGRAFRDMRFADFNNDGLDDVVSNSYGSGCAIIGLQEAAGRYNFFEPKRADGSCIGGHGETILVADFNSDGEVDILLPSYERFDFLQNQGQGKFVEKAAALGIAFPNYLPQVEGAAAVDVNMDGHVDIVIANEVLINNGRGGFKPQFRPFGLVPVFDEGMSVVDLDSDGVFDIVKHDPFFGPRIFWGRSDRLTFSDAGYLLGNEPTLLRSYGVATGHYTGRALADIFFAGGAPDGTPPKMCLQLVARRFECLAQAMASRPNQPSDLLLVTDLNLDGIPELASRESWIRVYQSGLRPANVFRIDLLDAKGRRNQFGHTVRAHCSVDNSMLGIAFVDGGNGFMAQGQYTISFQSPWCPSIWLDVATTAGVKRLGPFAPGMHSVRS